MSQVSRKGERESLEPGDFLEERLISGLLMSCGRTSPVFYKCLCIFANESDLHETRVNNTGTCKSPAGPDA